MTKPVIEVDAALTMTERVLDDGRCYFGLQQL
jgi:hypothetical protein